MMKNPVYLPLLTAFGGGIFLSLLRLRSRKARNLFTMFVTLTTTVCTGLVIFGSDGATEVLFPVLEGWTLALRVDDLSRVFAGLIAFLWPLATLYAFEYMEHETRENAFFTFYILTYGITLALAFSANLFTLYFFYEALSLITLPLVAHKQDEKSLRAGMTYMKYTLTGAALGLIGMIGLQTFGDLSGFTPGGSLDLAFVEARPVLFQALSLLTILGFSVKAAIFPFHRWLPMASVAPTPVTALLHAVAVVNAGAFSVIRVIYDCIGPERLRGTAVQNVTLALTGFTVAFGAVMAVREQHLKRRLAWSTVSNLNYMLFSACLMTREGVTGALAHLVFHGLIKISLFFCAGAYLIQTSRQNIRDLRGSFHTLPFVSVIFSVAAVALTGIPPFAGFYSKWEILSAALASGNPFAWCGIVGILLSAVLCAVYLLSPAVQFLFLGNKSGVKKDPGWRMKLPLLFLAVLAVFVGAFAIPLLDFLRQAVL